MREKEYNNIVMKAYQYVQDFSVKYYECDFKDEIKISTVLAYLEEVACASADELGFGYSYIREKGYAFVVSGICVEFDTTIAQGETVRLITWPTPPTHVVFGREYRLCANDGTSLANASSRWCMLDSNTGKILSSKLLTEQDYSTYNTAKALEKVCWKLPALQSEEAKQCFSMTVANSEYDHNMHVNNTRYADYCMNVFSVAELAQKQLKRFTISYVKQCFEGDTLRFYRQETGENRYLVSGINQKDETVVQAEIVFTEKERAQE